MTLNRAEIMRKANSLRKVYAMSKSESLTKAWAMAKLDNLEGRAHGLDLIDHWDREIRDLHNTIDAQIRELRAKIYPTIIEELYDEWQDKTYTREWLNCHAYDVA